jgi:Putative restriction endonuclease
MACVAPTPPPWGPSEIEAPDESLLVTEDDTPLDSILTEKQERLLSRPLYASWSGPPPREDGAARTFAVLANVGLFNTAEDEPVVPDLMLSLDVTVPADLGEKKNRSYFLWRYGKPPDVVIEIVSNTKGGELGKRRERYARLRVAYYVVYDPFGELGEVPLRAFQLHGDSYVELVRPWFEHVGLGLAEWEGAFEGLPRRWLRWCARDGKILPTGEERAADEKARAETAEARAETAEARAARLAARLRALGVDPDDG